ncbi:hypothetical protein KKA85_06575, partial [bacterium]|nr:hypothetical protein [bacterium]
MAPDLEPGYTVFATSLGACGLAWTRKGVDFLIAPENDDQAVRAELAAKCPGRPEVKRPGAPVRDVIQRLCRHLSGRPDPLTDVALDLARFSAFGRKVGRALRR